MNLFTPRAQQVLALARKEADRFNHNYVGTEHVLLGLIRLGQGVAVNVLFRQGVTLEKLRSEVEAQVGPRPDAKAEGNIPYTPRVKKVLALAGRESNRLGHSYVGTEHILLGIIAENDGAAARVLRTCGADLERTRADVLEELGTDSTRRASFPSHREPNRIPTATATAPKGEEMPPITLTPSLADPADMARSTVERYLAPDETLLWSGTPKKKFRIERKHWPILFFIVPFLAFMLLPIVGIFNSDDSGQTKAQPSPTEQTATATSASQPKSKPMSLAGKIVLSAFFLIFAGGIVAWTLYCMGFTLGGNAFMQGETFYGLTNQRLMVVAGKRQKTVYSVHLGTATDLRMKEWPDGLGSISFGPEPVWPYASPLRSSNTVLENIAEPRKVFRIIIDAQRHYRRNYL